MDRERRLWAWEKMRGSRERERGDVTSRERQRERAKWRVIRTGGGKEKEVMRVSILGRRREVREKGSIARK